MLRIYAFNHIQNSTSWKSNASFYGTRICKSINYKYTVFVHDLLHIRDWYFYWNIRYNISKIKKVVFTVTYANSFVRPFVQWDTRKIVQLILINFFILLVAMSRNIIFFLNCKFKGSLTLKTLIILNDIMIF